MGCLLSLVPRRRVSRIRSSRSGLCPFAKIEAFNSVLRRRPDGGELAEQICSLLLDHYGSSAKPVLLLRRNGNHWLGMLDYCPESRERSHRISHLHRCLAAS